MDTRISIGVEIVFVLLTLSGLAYLLIALWGARDFGHYWRRSRKVGAGEGFAPDVSILKPVKSVDERMYEGFVSHCRQEYGGRFEILFGVSSVEDAACPEIARLQAEFPEGAIRLVVCPERLGTSGKVSNLVQMLREARYEHVLINDSDIYVGPQYLSRVMGAFADARVGMVTAPYFGRAVTGARGLTVWSRMEALGISTDFMPGVLAARRLEGGIRFGLGSTLATTKTMLEKIGGLEGLVECLADDYEMGARIWRAGFRVELSDEVVETTVPAYGFRGFWEHQLRWARSTRDSRRWGYVGMGVTYAVPWAVMTCVASGFELWSFSLLSVVMLARVAVALSVGVGVLFDGQVLRDLWLLPARDFLALAVWGWSFAGDTVVWRGERFRLRGGRLERVSFDDRSNTDSEETRGDDQKVPADARTLIRDVLMSKWDPIGINDTPEAWDEYDFYIGTVYRLLSRDSSASDLAAYLEEMETRRMGLVDATGKPLVPQASRDGAVLALQALGLAANRGRG